RPRVIRAGPSMQGRYSSRDRGRRARHGVGTAALAEVTLALLVLFSPIAHAAVKISADATKNMDCSAGVCTPTKADAVLNANDLTSMLANGSVAVNTGSGQLASKVEDILVNAAFSWTSANSLTLDAYRSVTVNRLVADDGTGGVALKTNDGGSNGELS